MVFAVCSPPPALVLASDKMKVGRPDLCPCSSGKKFKKCHLNSVRLTNPSCSRERFR